MTYEEAKPFVEKLYEIAMWYHAKPNEFRRRAYEVVDDIAEAERERILEICKEGLWDAGGIRNHTEKKP